MVVGIFFLHTGLRYPDITNDLALIFHYSSRNTSMNRKK
jgi:hypothetical protein